MSIHTRIRERRLALGLESHKALAEKIGVAWQTVQQWEKEDGTAPNRSRIDSVAAALQCSVEWLTTGRGVEAPEVRLKEEVFAPSNDKMALHYITPREERLLENFRLSFEEGREKIEIAAEKTKKKSLSGVRNDEQQSGSL